MDRWLYLRYRANLRNIKPTTKQGREIHQLERIFYFWPMYAYIRWTQHKRK